MDRKQYMHEYYLNNKEKFGSNWHKIKSDPVKHEEHKAKRRGNGKAGRDYRSTRQQILEHLGGKCVICGTTENLEVNHRDLADTADRRKSKKSYTCRPGLKAIKNGDVDVELMCKKHHAEWSYSQRIAAMDLFASLPPEEQRNLTKKVFDDRMGG